MTSKPRDYNTMSETDKAGIDLMKVLEEGILRTIDELDATPGIDKRWLSIGRTHIQEGFSALVRSIAQPTRIEGELEPMLREISSRVSPE